MAGKRPYPPRRVMLFVVAVLVATLVVPFGPVAVRAATDLPISGSAVIADANGDPVRLRDQPGPSGAIIGRFPEGTLVDVVDGPIAAPEDGSLWYLVAVDGLTGYMAAIYLAHTADEALPAVDGDGAPSEVTGAAVIVNTNGDGIRCRAAPNTEAEILHRFVEGDPVDLLGEAVDGWQPVRCAGRTGYVAAEFIGSDDVTSTETGSATGTATVINTNGDGARCRDRADLDGGVIAVLPEGTVVTLRGVAEGAWQPVVCAGEDGFISSEFLRIADDPAAAFDGVGGPVALAETSAVTRMGQIQGTNGDGVRCRAKANMSATIIVVLAEGTQVSLRGAASGSWQPVTCVGQKGFVYSRYIGPIDDSGDGDAGGGSDSGLEPGDTAVVAGTNGDGVRLRSRASFSASVITVVGEGQAVQVRSGSTGAWVAVSYRGSDGFIHMDYLVRGSGGGGGSGGGVGTGDHAMVTENLRLRDDPSFDGEVLAIAVASTVVVVTGSAVDGFYPVDWDGLEGWMHGDYLDWTDAPTTSRDTGVGGDAGSEPGSADGQAMVDYAMNYLGYPYVYATHGPDTFDCSGFTYWVALHVLGEYIGTGTWTQSVEGRPVPYGQLQPGDLVFFQNTYKWGLSHVGIYIGDNQFIHAENEGTGVRISRVDSPYYSTRWYGARRLT